MNKFYYSDGTTSSEPDDSKVLHREDGPAMILNNSQYWYKNGYNYRDNDLPSHVDRFTIEYTNKKGRTSRLHGPAIIYTSKRYNHIDGKFVFKNDNLFAIDGEGYSEKDYYKEISKYGFKYYVKLKNYDSCGKADWFMNDLDFFGFTAGYNNKFLFQSQSAAIEYCLITRDEIIHRHRHCKDDAWKYVTICCEDKDNNLIFEKNIESHILEEKECLDNIYHKRFGKKI